ncbi:MAG: STAS domain-containing protein [Ignavibacteria bacterium]|nr:STAS domain-containing protein [Ignavibacteria bacterium]
MYEKFQVEKKRLNDIEIFSLKGILDAHTAPILENSMKETLENGLKKIIINFKNLEYISSAGLGVFMAFIEDTRNNNGDIKFSEMPDKIYSIFELLGFHLIFDILSNDEEAINYFRQNKLRTNE